MCMICTDKSTTLPPPRKVAVLCWVAVCHLKNPGMPGSKINFRQF